MELSISLNRMDGSRYKAILSESVNVDSKYDPSQNGSFEKTYELDFDPGGYFFHNSMIRSDKRY